jgi:hypothetical protein
VGVTRGCSQSLLKDAAVRYISCLEHYNSTNASFCSSCMLCSMDVMLTNVLLHSSTGLRLLIVGAIIKSVNCQCGYKSRKREEQMRQAIADLLPGNRT